MPSGNLNKWHLSHRWEGRGKGEEGGREGEERGGKGKGYAGPV